jgi:hypothetical protein
MHCISVSSSTSGAGSHMFPLALSTSAYASAPETLKTCIRQQLPAVCRSGVCMRNSSKRRHLPCTAAADTTAKRNLRSARRRMAAKNDQKCDERKQCANVSCMRHLGRSEHYQKRHRMGVLCRPATQWYVTHCVLGTLGNESLSMLRQEY